MVKLNKSVYSFASATQAKQVARSTVLRPVRSFCEMTWAKEYIGLRRTYVVGMYTIFKQTCVHAAQLTWGY